MCGESGAARGIFAARLQTVWLSGRKLIVRIGSIYTHTTRYRPTAITGARFTTFNYNSRPNNSSRVHTGGSSLLYVYKRAAAGTI